jgi:hypothetical protein
MASFDRYKKFKSNGAMKLVPFIEIPKKNSDLYAYYEAGKTRLDLLSYQYYDDANYGWLIMQANPEYGSLEFNIPDGTRLRIPYPLNTTITQYNTNIDKYIEIYGLD